MYRAEEQAKTRNLLRVWGSKSSKSPSFVRNRGLKRSKRVASHVTGAELERKSALRGLKVQSRSVWTANRAEDRAKTRNLLRVWGSKSSKSPSFVRNCGSKRSKPRFFFFGWGSKRGPMDGSYQAESVEPKYGVLHASAPPRASNCSTESYRRPPRASVS